MALIAAHLNLMQDHSGGDSVATGIYNLTLKFTVVKKREGGRGGAEGQREGQRGEIEEREGERGEGERGEGERERERERE